MLQRNANHQRATSVSWKKEHGGSQTILLVSFKLAKANPPPHNGCVHETFPQQHQTQFYRESQNTDRHYMNYLRTYKRNGYATT